MTIRSKLIIAAIAVVFTAIVAYAGGCGALRNPANCFREDPKHPGAYWGLPIDPDDCFQEGL